MSGRIEFVDDAGPEPSEPEPSDPGPSESAGHRRTTGHRRTAGRGRVVALLTLGVLAVAAVVVRALTSGSSAPAEVAGTAVARSPAPTVSVTRIPPPAPDTAVAPNLAAVFPGAAGCPRADDGLSACTATSALPAAVLTALRARFPQAADIVAYTEVSRATQRIWLRYIRFQDGASRIQVFVLQPGVSTKDPVTAAAGRSRFTQAVSTRPGSQTVVRSVAGGAAAARGSASATVRALADDARLTAV